MTEKSAPDEVHKEAMQDLATSAGTLSIQPRNEIEDPMSPQGAAGGPSKMVKSKSTVSGSSILSTVKSFIFMSMKFHG